MEGVSPVDPEERAHKFCLNLKFVPLACHEYEHEAADQLLCECLNRSFSILPAILLILSYLQIHRAITYLFLFCRPIVTTMK